MPVYGSYSNVASALTLNPGRAPIQPRLYLHSPAVVFAARVNQVDPAEYPVFFVAYDTVTTGAYTDIRPGMTLLLGSSAGGDQYGRQRVREVNDAGATTIAVWVGRSSRGTHDGELTLVDNAYVTVLYDYRVWAKVPFIDSAGEIFKDGALEVEWRTTEPPPVANCGAGFAGTIDPDTSVITVLFNGQRSFAVADGATITDYLWDIEDGTLSAGTLADDNITATFPPGFRYVRLTVTDSNGREHTAVCPVYARDPDDDTSFSGFDIEGAIRVTDVGQSVTIRALEDMPRATYPDGTLAMIWERESTGAADRDHMLMPSGWLDTENANINAGKTGFLRDTTITILDVAAKLDTLPGFPQAIADDATRDTELIPDITWNYMVDPTLHKYIHYLLYWHSTALELADFVISDSGDDYPFVLLASDGESLWNQVERRARAFVPDRVLTCDRIGRLAIVPDPQLQEVADRTAVVQAAITEDDYSDIRFSYQRAPRVHWLRGGAILAGTTQPIQTVFAIAPGDTPGQGVGEMTQGEQLALSQADFNAAIGHRYARANAPVGNLVLTLIQDDGAAGSAIPWRELEPALKQWVTVDLSAEFAAQRGLTFTVARGLPKELSIRYNRSKTGTTRTIELTVELETIGEPATTVIKPTVPPVGEDPGGIPPTIPPPDFGLIDGQGLVAGIGADGFLYRTADFTTVSGSGGPTWEAIDLTGGDDVLSWVVDPFSPGYIEGAGTIDGWLASATKLYRVTDLFGTPGCTVVHTFANTATWRSIQASFGTYFVEGDNPWLLCISYYGSTGGHTGTWALRSLDGGATFLTETLVSALYDSGSVVMPIGVYASPKTPGYALTVAHIETANPANSSLFTSADWGETWTPLSIAPVEDPDEPWPDWKERDDDEVETPLPPGASGFASHSVTVAGSDPTVSTEKRLILVAPINAVRVNVHVSWTASKSKTGGFASAGVSINTLTGSGVGKTGSINYTSPPGYTSNSGSGDIVYTLSAADWPENGVMFQMICAATGSSGHSATAAASVTAVVTEIELDDATIYVPPIVGGIDPMHGQGGEIHIPWPTNADEGVIFCGTLDRTGAPVIGLLRADAGVVTDISETIYGVNHGAFSLRTHDSDRQLVLLAGESGAGSRGVWTSSDGGDSWTQIVAPSAVDPYQAAWSGDLDGTVYIWGPSEYFGFSDDGGSSVDDRSGNLGALGASALVGIAGGPLP